MKRLRSVARTAMWASLVGLVIPPPLTARAESLTGAGEPLPVVDVVLDSNHRLNGQLVDGSGAPTQGQLLCLKNGQSMGKLATGTDGRFAIRLSQGGMYQLATADRVTVVRVWTQRAAPPNSQQQLVLVQGNVLRGQQGGIPYRSISPWVIGGVVAAAIGVPIILANHRQDRSDGS